VEGCSDRESVHLPHAFLFGLENHVHLVWVLKHRQRIMWEDICCEVSMCIRIFLEQNGAAIVEMNVRSDHVH